MSKWSINYPIIGHRIRDERIQLGYTQEELAEKADISCNYLSHIENGLSKFSFGTFIGLVNALSTTPNQILYDEVVSKEACQKEIINNYLDKMNRGQLEYIIRMLETICQFDIEKK